MKKRFLVLLVLLFSLVSVFVSAVNFVPYKTASGANVKYRGTNIDVMIPDEYIVQDRDFRAVWVSHLVSDFPSYQNVSQYKSAINDVLDTMEYFNMNAIIFHVRTHNNALYKSELNPVASYYRNVDFDVFDPLEYIIDESHKRGIEFHAWLNPYRLSTYSGTKDEFAATQPSVNVASDPEMILKVDNNMILNPGEPRVRDFIIDSVMEIIENYDVDAIHFDDYFYITGVDDYTTRVKYNSEGLSVDNFRRKQVDLFIEQLYNEMSTYNELNNRFVQLGISPSGIYRNGGYVPLTDFTYNEQGHLTYPLYSNTNGFSHYDAYLFSDTKKWIDEGWIDYIIPQSYWAFEQPSAAFADVMVWWDAALKHSDVNLYSGMGLYKAATVSSSDGWYTSENQAIDQVKFNSSLENVRGHSIFSYKHIKMTRTNATSNQLTKAFSKVKEQAWTDIALLPEIRTFDKIKPAKVTNMYVEYQEDQNVISFDKMRDAKFYVLYRGTNNVTFDNSQIIKIFSSKDEVITYTDNVSGDYVYGVRSMSHSNTLGEGVIQTKGVNLSFYVDDELIATHKSNQAFELPAIPNKEGYDRIDPVWSITEYKNLKTDTRIDAIYTLNMYNVKFYDMDGNLIDDVLTAHGTKAASPTAPKVDGYRFKNWDTEFDEVLDDLEINAVYEEIKNESPKTVFSCKELNYSFVLFSGLALLFLVFKRRK